MFDRFGRRARNALQELQNRREQAQEVRSQSLPPPPVEVNIDTRFNGGYTFTSTQVVGTNSYAIRTPTRPNWDWALDTTREPELTRGNITEFLNTDFLRQEFLQAENLMREDTYADRARRNAQEGLDRVIRERDRLANERANLWRATTLDEPVVGFNQPTGRRPTPTRTGRRTPSQQSINYKVGLKSRSKARLLTEKYEKIIALGRDYKGKTFSYEIFDNLGVGVWKLAGTPIVEIRLSDLKISKVMFPSVIEGEFNDKIQNLTRYLLRVLGIKAVKYKDKSLLHTGIVGHVMKSGDTWIVNQAYVQSFVELNVDMQEQLEFQNFPHPTSLTAYPNRLHGWEYKDIRGKKMTHADQTDNHGYKRSINLNNIIRIPEPVTEGDGRE